MKNLEQNVLDNFHHTTHPGISHDVMDPRASSNCSDSRDPWWSLGWEKQEVNFVSDVSFLSLFNCRHCQHSAAFRKQPCFCFDFVVVCKFVFFRPKKTKTSCMKPDRCSYPRSAHRRTQEYQRDFPVVPPMIGPLSARLRRLGVITNTMKGPAF